MSIQKTKINKSCLHAFWCDIITSWQQMFFDDWKFDFNMKCLKSITILWCYVLWTRCWFEYYIKKSKTLKIDFKRFKRFDQNSLDFESINNETFSRRNSRIFFVAMSLNNDNVIKQILFKRMNWNNAKTMFELQKLFNKNTFVFDYYIQIWKFLILIRMKNCYIDIKIVEIKIFEKKSYWKQ